MAAQAGGTASALPAAAHVVGNAFVNQYYNVLHQSPQVVHRFYTDASRLTRAEAGPDGAVDTVVSQSEIHQKVMALDYSDFKAEIVTVDSQDSLAGGVLVMVTGALSSQVSGKRKFVQSFFLAPQEKGYFVLNDVFRYLDEEPESVKQGLGMANGKRGASQVHISSEAEPVSTGLEVQETPPLSVSEVEVPGEDMLETSLEAEILESQAVTGAEDSSRKGVVAFLDEQTSPRTESSVPNPIPEETSEEVPRKSYASILRTKDNSGSTFPGGSFNTSSKMLNALAVERTSLASGAHNPASGAHNSASGANNPASGAVSVQDVLEEGLVFDGEGDGKSVYVKNLPVTISSSHLEEEFGKFGLVKPGGINVKNQKQGAVCYAFIEFEDALSAQASIESSPLSIGGRQVFIEEKRPIGSRSGGRGARVPGSGRSDRLSRSDGPRGRVSATGRGFSRLSGQETSSRGRGSSSVHARSGITSVPASSVSSLSTAGNIVGSSGNTDNFRRDPSSGNGHRGHRRGSAQAQRNVVMSRGTPPVAAT